MVSTDLCVIHLAAITDGYDAKVIVGRGMRAHKARMLSKNARQQRNLLHHAANAMIDYCVNREAGTR